MIRPLFIIGNKRSGTSHLVRLLNLHPHVFVSHESDIAWILYQFHRNRPFRAHAWDSEKGMRFTLESAGHLLQRNRAPSENFMAVQRHLMEKGTPWLGPLKKPDLLWIGDKKPFQHTDPRILSFILNQLPDAHFLHIVRHPFDVVASSDRFNRTRDGDFWLEFSPREKMERWAFHEKRVQTLRQTLKDRVHSLRYEDLCRRTRHELSAVFKFLGVAPIPQALEEASRQTIPAVHPTRVIQCSAEAARIARLHGYDVRRPTNRLRALGKSIGWRVVQRFER